MPLIVTLTGSYPPVRLAPPLLSDSEIEQSIHSAIRAQRAAVKDRPIQWVVVSGQPQNDIVGIYAPGMGLAGTALPYQVTQEIKYTEPITLRELEIAAEVIDGQQPLKAHITDPSLMAESCKLTTSAPSHYRDDPRQLTLDFAHALAEEAHLLTHTPNLGIRYLQIDAPTLAYGADLDLAHKGIEIVTSAVASGVQTILHVCGDVSKIMEILLEMPVDILNVENQHLNGLAWLNANRLKSSNKKFALGCIPVNVDDIPSVRWLERELLFAVERYGVQNIWGITPNCGLRFSDPDKAQQRLDRLAEVALKIATRFEQS